MLQDSTKDTTVMEEAFYEAGGKTRQSALKRLHKIAEECWEEASFRPPRPQGGGPKAHDPYRVMELFSNRIRGDAELLMELMGPRYFHNLIRSFLEKERSDPRAWKNSDSFRRCIKKAERKAAAERSGDYKTRRTRIDSDWVLQRKELSKASSREAYRRKVAGIKRVSADVNVRTGETVLIDKEYGPFTHIRISGLKVAECTTEQVLAHCDRSTTDVTFLRALCQLIPDPRKSIGEQWTAEIIKEAKAIAQRKNAA